MLKNIEQAKALAAKWLRHDEKYMDEKYLDPGDGSPRIGYGSNCPPGMTECDWLTAERMLQADLEQCATDVYAYLGHNMTPDFNVARLAVLYCMAYQMGHGGLCSFKKMRKAISAGDEHGVADAMLDSQWHKQTPERCERLALTYRLGRE